MGLFTNKIMDFSLHVSYSESKSKALQGDEEAHKQTTGGSYAEHIQNSVAGTSDVRVPATSAFNTLVEYASNLTSRGQNEKSNFS